MEMSKNFETSGNMKVLLSLWVRNMLEINTLSSPEIVVGNEKVSGFVSRKALALVVYLAINSGSCSREELADLLWSDRSQERAARNLRVVLWDIRKKVGDYLSIDRHSVSISESGDIWVDVHQLLEAIESKNLDLAISLYKGDFLESFYLRGASRFENWQVIEREKIRLELVDGLSETIHLLLKAGKSQEAIKYLKHLLSLEPLLESAHRQLMQVYFENGEVSRALKQFEICKQTLSEELSVTPAEETQNLYAHIAQHRLSAKLVSAIPHNLPNFTTPFIGQKDKIRELTELLSNPDVSHLSLVGPGGYGKSRLAIHLAKKSMNQFPDGVFWVPLQSLEKESELATAVANAIGLISQTEKDIKNELLDYLRSRQTLLVLDNFEHLISGGRLVSEILTSSQHVKIITTSRQKLNLKGETIFIVRGMDYPIDDGLASDKTSAKIFDAVQLFIKSATRSSPSFKPDTDKRRKIARICKSVDGMPLAIELAAGWVPVLSLMDIEREIIKGFNFLEGKLQDVEERHQSLQAVAEGSWSMLTEAERSVFKKLSLLKGPFTRRSAKKIARAEINDLLSLSNKSFLQKDSEGLLRIHEWLRQYGEIELKKSKPRYFETLELFAHHYVTFLAESEWEAWSGKIQKLRLEWANISEALLVAARAGDFQLLRKGLAPFFYVSYVGEDFSDSTTLFGKMIAEFEKKDLSDNERLTYALCLAFYTYFLETQNKYEQVIEIYDKVETLISGYDQGLEYAWIRAIENLVNIKSDRESDRERMHKNTKQALMIFTKQKDDYALTFTYNVLARRSFGDNKRMFGQKALALARKHNGFRDIARALMELGRTEVIYGDLEKAAKYLSEAHSRFTIIQSLNGMVHSSGYMGLIAHQQGKYSQAKAYYEHSLRLSERVGWKNQITDDKEFLGAIAVAMKDYELGRKLILESTSSSVENIGDNLPFWVPAPEIPMLLDYLGYPELAVIVIAKSINHPAGEEWKPLFEEQLDEYKSRYPQEEMSKWIEKAKHIKPIELATAIRDALSDDSVTELTKNQQGHQPATGSGHG